MIKEEFRKEFPGSKFGKYIERKITERLIELRTELELATIADVEELQGRIRELRKLCDALNLTVKPELMTPTSTSDENL